MLRTFVILSTVGYCLSRPQLGDVPTVLEYVNVVGPFGYNFRYSTSDGVGREERGELMYPGTPQENYVVQGKTTWTSPEGIPYIITFVSDNNGYRTIKPEAYQPFIPAEHSVYSVAHQPNVLEHSVPPYVPQQHSVYPTATPQPAHRPDVAKPVTSKPTLRPVKPYVPPSKSSSFGPEEDRLPVNSQPSTGDLQRTADGIVPVGPPKIGAGTAAALIG